MLYNGQTLVGVAPTTGGYSPQVYPAPAGTTGGYFAGTVGQSQAPVELRVDAELARRALTEPPQKGVGIRFDRYYDRKDKGLGFFGDKPNRTKKYSQPIVIANYKQATGFWEIERASVNPRTTAYLYSGPNFTGTQKVVDGPTDKVRFKAKSFVVVPKNLKDPIQKAQKAVEVLKELASAGALTRQNFENNSLVQELRSYQKRVGTFFGEAPPGTETKQYIDNQLAAIKAGLGGTPAADGRQTQVQAQSQRQQRQQRQPKQGRCPAYATAVAEQNAPAYQAIGWEQVQPGCFAAPCPPYKPEARRAQNDAWERAFRAANWLPVGNGCWVQPNARPAAGAAPARGGAPRPSQPTRRARSFRGSYIRDVGGYYFVTPPSLF